MERTRPKKLAHIVYRTNRFDEMLEWYQQVFGAKVQLQNPALAFLTWDDEHHRIALANLAVLKPDLSEPAQKGMTGVDHVAYTYTSIDHLFENYRQLKSEGIEPYWCVHHGLTVSMYYADPDGNQMEFQVEVFDSSEEALEFMCGPAMAENPVGVEYDPEDWLAQQQAGTPLSEFLVRKADEPVSPIRGQLGA